MKTLLIASFILLGNLAFSQIKVNKTELKKTTEKVMKKERKSSPSTSGNTQEERKRPGKKTNSTSTERKRPGASNTKSTATKSGGGL